MIGGILNISAIFVSLSIFLLGSTSTFTENWESGSIDLNTWKKFGYPSSILLSGEGVEQSWGFDSNGDGWYASGVCSHTNYNLAGLPRVDFWARGNGSHWEHQSILAYWSKFNSDSYGGVMAQPEALCQFSIDPATNYATIRYMLRYPELQSVTEPWISSIYDKAWMFYGMRINPSGTVSFFRQDTLRLESDGSIFSDEWEEQTFVIDGRSYGSTPQTVDDITISFPSLHEDWENGLSPFAWKLWGTLCPETIAGQGISGSTGFIAGEGSDLNGVASLQLFDLSARPSIRFSVIGNSNSGSDAGLIIGWSSSNASGYGTQPPPELLASIDISPGELLITYSQGTESFEETWLPGVMDDVWQNYGLRINPDSTVSFFRRDTLRFTTTSSIDINSWTEQALTLQGNSFSGSPVLDELIVYPYEQVPTSYLQPLSSIFMLDGACGWAIGSGGVVLKTENNGEMWTVQPTDVTLNLNDAVFVSSQRGWIASDSGTVLVTVDGEQWIQSSSGTTANLNTIDFANNLSGWVAGEDGFFAKTDNAGLNWAEQLNPITGDITSLEVVDQMHVFASGSAGQIVRTTCGGASWDILDTGITADLSDLSFSGFLNGWVVGEAGLILNTSTGGENWIVQDTPTSVDLNCVSFFDSYHGWAVGESGTVLFTEDGGINWNLRPIGQFENSSFTAVHAFAEQTAWTVCDSGLLSLGDYYTGVESEESTVPRQMLRVLQNPVSSGATLSLEIVLSESESGSVWIYDISGRVIQSRSFTEWNAGLNRVSIPMQDSSGRCLAAGIYFIQCKTSEAVDNQSVIVLGDR